MPNKTSFSQVLGNGVFPCACRGITAPVTQAPEPSPQTEPLHPDYSRACPVLLMGTVVEARQKPLCKSEFIPLRTQEISPTSPKCTSVPEIPTEAVYRDADTQGTAYRDF